MTSYRENELLKVEQFAERLQVSRTTVFGWLKDGKLQEGVHYFRIDRVLRFRWPFFLAAAPSAETNTKTQGEPEASKRSPVKHVRGITPVINIDY